MTTLGKKNSLPAPRWRTFSGLQAYPDTVNAMERHVAAILDGTQGEEIWLLEHPPLYTAGTSAKPQDLLNPRFPVFESGRGGQYTYHGPGQQIAYLMLDLNKRGKDVRRYVWLLEEWLIRTLADFGVTALRREGRVGLWVERSNGVDDKIAAIGVRVRRWITLHGIALNVNPDLSHYAGIVPCGIREHGITSLAALGKMPDKNSLEDSLIKNWQIVFQGDGAE